MPAGLTQERKFRNGTFAVWPRSCYLPHRMETPPPIINDQPPVPAPAPGGKEERQWIVALHASALIGFIIPVGNIIAPLVIWLLKKPEFPTLDPIGRAVLNFQISWTIWMIVSIVIAAVGSCLIVPIFLPIGLWIAWLVFVILGSVKASNGEDYKYPLTIKML